MSAIYQVSYFEVSPSTHRFHFIAVETNRSRDMQAVEMADDAPSNGSQTVEDRTTKVKTLLIDLIAYHKYLVAISKKKKNKLVNTLILKGIKHMYPYS